MNRSIYDGFKDSYKNAKYAEDQIWWHNEFHSEFGHLLITKPCKYKKTQKLVEAINNEIREKNKIKTERRKQKNK